MNKTITNNIYTTVKNRTNGEIVENAANLEDMARLICDEDFRSLVSELREQDETKWQSAAGDEMNE